MELMGEEPDFHTAGQQTHFIPINDDDVDLDSIQPTPQSRFSTLA
jgi:hypothetical protein